MQTTKQITEYRLETLNPIPNEINKLYSLKSHHFFPYNEGYCTTVIVLKKNETEKKRAKLLWYSLREETLQTISKNNKNVVIG